jgi:transposase-like protein
MAKRDRREYSEEFKKTVVGELAQAKKAGITRSSIVSKHGISDSLSRLWEGKYSREVGSSYRATSVPSPPRPMPLPTLEPMEGQEGWILAIHGDNLTYQEERYQEEKEAVDAYVRALVTNGQPALYRCELVEVEFSAGIKGKVGQQELALDEPTPQDPQNGPTVTQEGQEEGKLEEVPAMELTPPSPTMAPSVRVRKKKAG